MTSVATAASRQPRVATARALARWLSALLSAAALLSALACTVASHLLWNWTPSLPLGLYWLSPGRPIAVGTLVALPVPSDVQDLVRDRKYLPPRALLIKPVVALSSDRVCTDGGTLVVNGSMLGAVLAADGAKRPLPHATGCGPLPQGQVFLASRYPKSFDSRTFGPVSLTQIRGTVTPLWTY
jgi:conjugative transfer signal peptidase TraF